MASADASPSSNAVITPGESALLPPVGVARRLVVAAGCFAVAFVIGYFLFIANAWGHELDNEAYLGRESEGRFIATTGGHILSRVTAGALALGLIALVVIGAALRAFVAAVIAVIGVGVAVAGAQVLKATLPWSPLAATDADLPAGLFRETYPSGHTTIGSTLAMAVVMIIPASARWWAAPIAGFSAALFAAGVVIAGWHRPSDAIGGIFWSAVVMCLAAAIAVRLRGREPFPMGIPDSATRIRHRQLSLRLCIATAVSIYAILIVVALVVRAGLPDADLAFALLIGIILMGVFAVQGWFANTLSQVSFQTPDTLST